jgi:hypothetical protein
LYEQLIDHYREEHLRGLETKILHCEALKDLEHERRCRCRCHAGQPHQHGIHPGRKPFAGLFRGPRGA